jgi:hypothetical protein
MTILSGLLNALPSEGKSSDLADVDDIFGWMIGSWDVEAVLYDSNGREHRMKGRSTRHGCWKVEQFKTSSFFRVEPTAPLRVGHREAIDMGQRSGPSTGN